MCTPHRYTGAATTFIRDCYFSVGIGITTSVTTNLFSLSKSAASKSYYSSRSEQGTLEPTLLVYLFQLTQQLHRNTNFRLAPTPGKATSFTVVSFTLVDFSVAGLGLTVG